MKGESMRKFHLIYAVILILALAACAGADIKNTSSDSAPGRTAPDFALPDQDGKLWKLSDALKEHRAVVLAFYPKDDTRE
jgi:cytochrome oxidase Cu insertion factor (SCO1/SenC/PrrC family)